MKHCEICNKKFVSKISLKKHKKVFHGPRVDFPCQFCAGTPKAYIGHTTTNIQQHIKGCPGNPNRVILHCKICKDFTTYWPKKITEHKKNMGGKSKGLHNDSISVRIRSVLNHCIICFKQWSILGPYYVSTVSALI